MEALVNILQNVLSYQKRSVCEIANYYTFFKQLPLFVIWNSPHLF